MNDFPDPALDPEAGLLPAGFRDVLPPRAEVEAQTSESLMAAFAAWGYQRVKPPLAEFEETLLSGPGQALAGQTFRFMDPAAQRMLGLRADITVQVSRIAGTRLRGVVKAMGLKKGEQVEVLGIIEVVNARRERLNEITAEDVVAEGFPELSRRQFIDMFCKNMKCRPTDYVTRIEYRYVE